MGVSFRAALHFCCIFLAAAIPAGAQTALHALPLSGGSIAGTIRDTSGEPWPDIVINFYTPSGGLESSVKTADDGKYRMDLVPGTHLMKVVFEYRTVATRSIPIYPGIETLGDMNFKYAADAFADLQKHYGEGEKLLKSAKALRDEMEDSAANGKRAGLQPKLNSAADKAITEFRKALASAEPNDSFFDRFAVLNILGEAYDAGGRYPQAIEAYHQALDLRQDAAVYDNLGNALAKAGDLKTAGTAYQKSMELDPPNAGRVYRDWGISLYNADKLADALEPLRTSTQLDPRNAQGWYVLGAALVGVMYKQQAEKGGSARTDREKLYREALSAYQKAIDLGANSKWRGQAQAGVKQLQQISQGNGAQMSVVRRHIEA